MKKILFLITFVFCFIIVNGQTKEKAIACFYGANYFMPSKGYAHSLGIQKLLTSSNFGSLKAEVSVLLGGPYGFNLYATEDEIKNKISPYKAFHSTIGLHYGTNLNSSHKDVLSGGIFLGYSRYEIPVTIQTPNGLGASVRGYFDPRHSFLVGATIRYSHWIKLNHLDFAIVPNYTFYKTSIFTQSLGVMIVLKI